MRPAQLGECVTGHGPSLMRALRSGRHSYGTRGRAWPFECCRGFKSRDAVPPGCAIVCILHGLASMLRAGLEHYCSARNAAAMALAINCLGRSRFFTFSVRTRV